jgi:hypothetical protein
MAVATAADERAPGERSDRRILPAIIGAILLVWVGWWGYHHVLWWTPAGHDIARAVDGAMSADQTLLTPPQAYRGVPVTPAQLSTLSRRAQEVLATYYTGHTLQQWRQTARALLNPRNFHHGKSIQWRERWRVDWVHLGDLTMDSRGATASASMQASAGGAISRMDYTYHLVDTPAGWRIDRWNFKWEGGFGP